MCEYGEVDDNDEEAVQSAVQSTRGIGGNPGREDAQPVGIAVQSASHANREMAEGGDRPTPRSFRGWPDPEAKRHRGRQRCTVSGDRSAESRTGLAQKKSRHARLTSCARWWIGGIQISAFGDSVNCCV